MKTTQNQLSNCKIEITFEFDENDINPNVAKALENISGDIKVDGFRAGKVPGEIVKQKVGDAVVFDEAVRLTIQEKYPEYIEANNIDVVASPDVLITKLVVNKEAECKITVEIIPSLEVKGYAAIAKEAMKDKKEVKVEEAEINDTIKWVLDSRSTFIELEREVKEGDIVDIDHEIIVEDKPQEELKAINYKFIVGKEQTYLELNSGILNMKKGEVKEIEISFSKEFYIDALKEKKGIMKVTLNKILERKTPELNDEFVQKLGKFENAEAFKKSISEGILKEKEMREEERIKVLILENIRKTITTDVPEALIERESGRMIEDIKYKISEMGMEFEVYLKQVNKTEEDIRKDIHEEAKNKVIDALILREIIKIEKLDATPEEIENKTQEILNEVSAQNPNIHDADKSMIRNYSEEIIKNEKVFNFLMGVK